MFPQKFCSSLNDKLVNWNHCLFTVIIRHFIRNMCLLIKTTRSHLCLRQHFNPLHLWPRNLIGVRMPNQYLQPANLPKSDAKRRYIFTKDVVHITFIHMRRWNNETIQLLSYISNYFTGYTFYGLIIRPINLSYAYNNWSNKSFYRTAKTWERLNR